MHKPFILLIVANDSQNFFKKFYTQHRIISTIIIIAIADCIILIASYLGLGWFTNHNDSITVPELHGLTAEEAANKLAECNLKLEINDSIYVENVEPGHIIEQNPKAGSEVKSNRSVYVIIRTYATKLVTLPAMIDMSARQGESILKSAGIKNVIIETVPSEYADLVYEVKWNGSTLYAGDQIPVSATVTLVVGDGSLSEIIEDSLFNLEAEEIIDDYVLYGTEY